MGMAGYSKLINGLLAVASGALYTEVRAYCLHVLYKEGASCRASCCPLIHDITLHYITLHYITK